MTIIYLQGVDKAVDQYPLFNDLRPAAESAGFHNSLCGLSCVSE